MQYALLRSVSELFARVNINNDCVGRSVHIKLGKANFEYGNFH
jgi:hypothetical protein